MASKALNEGGIQDGYNCITKDGLDNIFLTYFFKLPSCSPSDRTQVRIESNNILKLKIIQETKFKTRLQKNKTTNKKTKVNKKAAICNHTCSRHKSTSSHVGGGGSNSSSSNTKGFPFSVTTSLSTSINSNESSSSSDSFDDHLDSSTTSTPKSTTENSIDFNDDYEYDDDEDEDDEDEDDDSAKIMLREFSRQCRLPRNLFEFDEKGVTVSFVNNVWVRVEIPILDFLQPIYDFQNGARKKQLQSNDSNTFENNTSCNSLISSTNSNNMSGKKKSTTPSSSSTAATPSLISNNNHSDNLRREKETNSNGKHLVKDHHYLESKYKNSNAIIKI